MRMQEYKRFACVRAGHHLQLMNVLDALESASLSFDKSSVVFLLAQTVWQIGPLNGFGDICDANSKVTHSASQAHFANLNYVRKLHDTLKTLTASIEKKWTGQNALFVVILLAQRAIAMMPSCAELLANFLELLLDCRRIGVEWQLAIREAIAADRTCAPTTHMTEELHYKLTCVCSFTALTYDVEERVARRMWRDGPGDVVTWLSSMAELHKLRAEWPTGGDYFADFVLSRVDRCSMRLERQFVEVADYSSLTRFITLIWPDALRGRLAAWQRMSDRTPIWYTCSFHKYNADTSTNEVR